MMSTPRPTLESIVRRGGHTRHFQCHFGDFRSLRCRLKRNVLCYLTGKSSLINSLMQIHGGERKVGAQVSNTPGRTQTINYYAIVSKDKLKGNHAKKKFDPIRDSLGYLVDLPGYGHASAPNDLVGGWQDKTMEFLQGRGTGSDGGEEEEAEESIEDEVPLRRTYLLFDARTGLLNLDRAVMGWFDEARLPYTVVLTKADKVSIPKLVKIVNEICMRYHSQIYGQGNGYQSPLVHVTSARKGIGLEELMWSIETVLME
mmetsp:Transcript_23553/g.53738  ORF Transcript_23553/g.53738 Transcript_23553/m.53738 type:complete len:258 (-) Transcript_23553:104-877(-)